MGRASDFAGEVRQALQAHAEFVGPVEGEEAVFAFDDERGEYLLLYQGWDGIRRVHHALLHLELRDGKVWIQHDGTEDGIANELIELGVPKDRIVLGFHHPDERKYTEFAVA